LLDVEVAGIRNSIERLLIVVTIVVTIAVTIVAGAQVVKAEKEKEN
jgi:hypothetical protein